jgi:hypothetical protein
MMPVVQPVLTPTVEMALDRFDAEWPICWLVYGDDSLGWKDPHVSRVFVRIDGLSHEPRCFREYQVRAVKVDTAIERAVELIASVYPLEVTIYKVQLPPTAEMVGVLESENARIQRDPAWGRALGPRRGRTVGTGGSGSHRGHVSPERRRRMPVGL